MSKKKMFVEESDSEEYLHKETWRVVKRQIEHAETKPQGALYDDLVAMVFAFHCMEGYLNFVGEKIEPGSFKEEKKNFSRKGIEGKLKIICERCGIGVPDKNKRPYSTVLNLKNFETGWRIQRRIVGTKKSNLRRTRPLLSFNGLIWKPSCVTKRR